MFFCLNICYIRFFIGSVGLSLATLIYLTDRSPESTYFVHQFFQNFGQIVHNSFPDLFGNLDKNIPSFLHTFSFTMITSAFMGKVKPENALSKPKSSLLRILRKKNFLIVPIFWCVINIMFEVGQHFKTIALQLIPHWFDQYFILKTIDDYFINGVFDFSDIGAILVGAIVGYWVLIFTSQKNRNFTLYSC